MGVLWECIPAYPECFSCDLNHAMIESMIKPKCPHNKKQYFKLWPEEDDQEEKMRAMVEEILEEIFGE